MTSARSCNVKLLCEAGNIVGESIVWDDRSHRLVWIDILGQRIYRFAPASGKLESWRPPDLPTSIGLCKNGGAIVGLLRDIQLWDFNSSWVALATPEPHMLNNRLNEGCVAPDGSFWVGTMCNNFLPDGTPVATSARTGAYYRVSASGLVSSLLPNTHGIPNTMVWTDDGRFLTADTALNEIRSYRLTSLGELTDPQQFAESFPRGLPDGSCLDEDGFLWNCRVLGGSCVVRFSPDGSVDCVIDLHCSWPTSCTFGGPDLDVLYVTSARFTMDAQHLAANPHEGGIFSLAPGVRGRRSYRYG